MNPDVEEVRNILKGTRNLKDYSSDQLRRFLDLIDPMMEQELEETREAYLLKQKPITDVSLTVPPRIYLQNFGETVFHKQLPC